MIKSVLILIFKFVIIRAFSRKRAVCHEKWKLNFRSSLLANRAVQKPQLAYFCRLKNAGIVWSSSKYCLFSIMCARFGATNVGISVFSAASEEHVLLSLGN